MNIWRIIVAALASLLLSGVYAPPALAADEFLDASDPAPRQELQRRPGWVTLVFKAEADASLAAIVVVDSSGRNVTTGPLIVEGTNVTAQLATGLPMGTYTVHYRTTDEFGERRGGAFQFAYGKGDWTPLPDEVWKGESAQPTILADQPQTPTPSPTEEPTPTGTPAPTSAPSPTPPAPPGGSPADPLPWLLGGLVLAAGLAGAGYWAYRRRR